MQLHMLQLLFIAAAIIGSTQAAIATLPNAQEFATSTGSLLNVDSLLAFPQETLATSSDGSSSFSNTNRKVRSLEIIPCSISDPNKNECIRDLFAKVVPELKTGLPEYGLVSIDPYFYKRGIFRYAGDGLEGGLLIMNMQIHGISTLKVKSFAANFTDNGLIVKVGLEIKQLKAGGQFKADVKFGGLRFVPKGPFNITLDNIRATILTDGIFIKKGDSQRLQLQRLNANLAVGNAKIVADGIFSDPNLNTMMLNLVNENLPEIIRVGVPATRDQWAPVIVEQINNVFAEVPIEKFLAP